MSKFSQLLIMVKMLEEGRVLPTKVLAEKLNVSERMIRKYTNDIKEAGLPLRSIPGPGGGYYLDILINRPGRFRIDKILVRNNTAELIDALKDVLVVNVDNDYAFSYMTYTGYSKHFDLIKEAEMIPEYRLIVHSTGEVEWERI